MSDEIERHMRWMEQRGLRPVTIYGRRNLLRRVEVAIGRPLLAASHEDLSVWRGGLVGGTGTVAAYLTGLRTFYRWAVLEELIAKDPSRRIASPRVRPGLPHPIPEVELERAVLLAPPRVRPWLLLAAYAGLRAQEIAYLRGEDLVLDGPAPHVIVSQEAGKGGRQRVIPLSPKVVGPLAALNLPRRGYVFPRGDGRPGPNGPHRISQAANDHLHEIGIDLTLHSLRHRFGTRVYAVSLDLRMTQEVMGHSSPATTAGYVLFNQQAAMDAVKAI